MKKTKSRSSQVAFSWGILLSMLVLPVLALMAKIFPQNLIIWQGLMVAAGLVIARCAVGYILAGGTAKSPSADDHADAVPHAH